MDILSEPAFWYTFISIVSAFIICYISLGLRSSRKYLFRVFKANQKLSIAIQNSLAEFIKKHQADGAIALQDTKITYGELLEQMQAEYKANLSEELYLRLKKRRFSKVELTNAIDSLNKQNEALRFVDNNIKLVIRKVESWEKLQTYNKQ